jgi:hypothetical protein
MDFNTGTGGTGGQGGSPPTGPSQRTSASAQGGEFNYQDPVQSFISTVQRVVLQPVDFFRGIPRQGDFLNPLIFAIICYAVSAILGGLIGLAFSGRGFGGFIGSIIGTPIAGVVGLFIGAGILYLLVMLIVGSRNAGDEATFRVLAYSSVVNLVSWIPIIGGILSLYALYLGIVGIREVHTTTTGKAALVVLIPAAVVLLIVFLIVGAAALFFLSQR